MAFERHSIGLIPIFDLADYIFLYFTGDLKPFLNKLQKSNIKLR
jgi:hypothetical protein